MPAWTMLRMKMLKTRKGAKPVTREASDQRLSPFREKSWYFKVLTMARWMPELKLELELEDCKLEQSKHYEVRLKMPRR